MMSDNIDNLIESPDWSLSPREAVKLQARLAPTVVECPLPDAVRFVAGLDLAFTPDKRSCIAGVVLWDVLDERVLEQHFALTPVTFPYVPGLLSFREIPALLSVLKKLGGMPDVLMCDGQGVAHPRRFGLASHLGVLLDIPTVGCAKSRLIGTHDEPGPAKGDSVAAFRQGRSLIGRVLRTRDSVKPLYVSIGHKADIESACHLVLDCTIRYRLPEPTRLADRLVASAKRDHGK